GLDVHVEGSAGAGSSRVVIDPGYAIALNGDEIALARAVALPVSLEGTEGYVTLRPWDHPCLDGAPSAESPFNAHCIEEACIVAVAADVPPHALAVARLRCSPDGWVVDSTYELARAR